jgi:general secretion pathway protein M
MSVRARFEKLEPREQRLLTVLMIIFATGIFMLLPYFVYTAVSERRARNTEVRDLISKIQDARGSITERKARYDSLVARYAKPAPPLAGFIEEAARAHGITVPEAQDKPEIPHGKRYSERVTVVKMHKIGMLNLVKMLEKIEQSGYPVAITRLSIKPRSGEPDSYEVELGVSAFDRKADPKAEGKADAPGSGSAAPAAGESTEREESL